MLRQSALQRITVKSLQIDRLDADRGIEHDMNGSACHGEQ